ncbi:hypothetical protein ACQ4PT_066253 [Festuca glaucescens]
MAAVNSSGLTSPVGVAGASGDAGGEGDGGGGDFAELAGLLAVDVDCCGSSNPAAPKFSSSEKAAAAAAVAKVWKEHPLDIRIPRRHRSNNMNKGKQIVDAEEETQFAEDIQGCSNDVQEDGDYMQEDEVDSESDEECELNQRLIDLKKRKRVASHQFCKDEEAEDIFCDLDGSDDSNDCELLSEAIPVMEKKLPVRKGTTTRSHCSQQSTTPADYMPSDDEGQDGDLDPEDDDGFETLS